jgi:hypothetical protein
MHAAQAPEAAWRVRARQALQPLLHSSVGEGGGASASSAPLPLLVCRRALDVLDAVLHRAAAAGGRRSVSVGALKRFVSKGLDHDGGAPLSAAHAAPHGAAGAAACKRAVSAVVRALQAAGWSASVKRAQGDVACDAMRLRLRWPPAGNAHAEAAQLRRGAEMRELVAELFARADALEAEEAATAGYGGTCIAGQCRVLVSLPDGGLARMLLPLSARLLEVYAAVTAHLQKDVATRAADDDDGDDVVAPPVELAPFNWSAPRRPADTDAYRLMRRMPAHTFAPSELCASTFTLAAVLAGEVAAGPGWPRVLRLSVEQVGGGDLCMQRPLVALTTCCVHILRTSHYISPVGNNIPLASPIVHLRNVDGSSGGRLCAALRPLLPPAFGTPFGSVSYTTLSLCDCGAVAVPSYLAWASVHPSTGELQEYGRDILRRAANALRTHDADGAAAAAADVDAAVSRPFSQVGALGYSSLATLHNHVDSRDGYLVLLSIGCTVDFYVSGSVIEFASGDALIFNGSVQHNVMHGVRGVRPGTCPRGLPAELRDARISVQLRQRRSRAGAPA